LERDEEAEDAGNKVRQLQDKIWEYRGEFGIKSFLSQITLRRPSQEEMFLHR
jgi:hypothetical protein